MCICSSEPVGVAATIGDGWPRFYPVEAQVPTDPERPDALFWLVPGVALCIEVPEDPNVSQAIERSGSADIPRTGASRA